MKIKHQSQLLLERSSATGSGEQRNKWQGPAMAGRMAFMPDERLNWWVGAIGGKVPFWDAVLEENCSLALLNQRLLSESGSTLISTQAKLLSGGLFFVAPP